MFLEDIKKTTILPKISEKGLYNKKVLQLLRSTCIISVIL